MRFPFSSVASISITSSADLLSNVEFEYKKYLCNNNIYIALPNMPLLKSNPKIRELPKILCAKQTTKLLLLPK